MYSTLLDRFVTSFANCFGRTVDLTYISYCTAFCAIMPIAPERFFSFSRSLLRNTMLRFGYTYGFLQQQPSTVQETIQTRVIDVCRYVVVKIAFRPLLGSIIHVEKKFPIFDIQQKRCTSPVSSGQLWPDLILSNGKTLKVKYLLSVRCTYIFHKYNEE